MNSITLETLVEIHLIACFRAHEAELVELAEANKKVVIRPTSKPDRKELRETYCDLYHAWDEWRKLSCGGAD